MDPLFTHSLYTYAVAVGIVSLCVGTLLALPRTAAAQESTERGLIFGFARITEVVEGLIGVARRLGAQPG